MRSAPDVPPDADDAARALVARLGFAPGACILAGTGAGPLVEQLDRAVALDGVPGLQFAHGVPPHGGRLRGLPVVVGGALLPYHEGHAADRIVAPLRTLRRAGAGVLVLTGGAASLAAEPAIGTVAIAEDHLDLSGRNLLREAPDPACGPRFLDQSEPYAASLRALVHRTASTLGLRCPEVVLAAVPGPMLPTRAEARALALLGARLVVMSLVPEAIAARHAGFAVLALAAVTQRLDAGSPATDVAAVLAAADAVHPHVLALLLGVAEELARAAP